MSNQNDLVFIVTYVIVFLAVFVLAIVVFIEKSRRDRISIENQKKEIESIAKQKTMLLKEIHHRVKNNLQLISGLLYLQVVKHKNKEVSTMVEESQKHINSIALVHEMLYQNDSLSLISMKEYLAELGNRLLQIGHQKKIEYKLNVPSISLPIDYATTLGLICNELITNSLKYAFEGDEGKVFVSLIELNESEYSFCYSDNGKGCDLNQKKEASSTLGQKLIQMFADEIDADLKISNEGGLRFEFRFNTKAA